MGLFDRFRRVVRSNINDMITKAENPEKMLNQLIVEMNEQLIESKKSVASAIADEKRLQRQLIEQRRNTELWEQRAMDAVRAGKDELAKQALVRKQEHAEYTTSYQEQYDAQHASVEQLKDSLRQLQQKIEEASRKKNLLIARAKRAEAQQRIQATITATGNTSAFDAFDRNGRQGGAGGSGGGGHRRTGPDRRRRREAGEAVPRAGIGRRSGPDAGGSESQDGPDRGQELAGTGFVVSTRHADGAPPRPPSGART